MTTLADLIAGLDGKDRLTADDALQLRRVIYGGDGKVAQDEAEALVRLHRDAHEVSPEWQALYAEALADFVVRQQVPTGYVDEAKAGWLMQAFGPASGLTEGDVDALLHVLDAADSAPATLGSFTLQAVKAMLLARTGSAHAIGRKDVERLRQAVYASAGEGNIEVTHAEADVLFEVNEAFRTSLNDPVWTDFFVRAVANSVLCVQTYTAPSAKQVLEDEAWLRDTKHPLGLAHTKLHRGGILNTFKETAPDIEAMWAKRGASDAAMEAAAAEVTREEAEWLLGRMRADGKLDHNERALIRFLCENASRIDPLLQPLIDAVHAQAA